MFWRRKMTPMWKCWNTQQNNIPFLRYNTLPSLKMSAPEGMVKRLSLHLVLIVLSVFLYVFAHTKSWPHMYVCARVLTLTLCDPMDGSLPGSSVHGIFQARILEWVSISFSRGYSQLRDWIHISCSSCIAGGFFTHWAIRETWPHVNHQVKDHKGNTNSIVRVP